MLYYLNGSKPRLELDAYQKQARSADQNKSVGAEGLRIPLLGLFGEVGSLLSAPKRKQREDPTYETYADTVIEEFGDVLWYLSNLASRHRVPLSALADARGEGENLRIQSIARPSLTFHHLDSRARSGNSHKSITFHEADFFALGGAVGRLMSEYAAGEHWGIDRREFLLHLARTFKILVRTAQSAKISLNFAALNNLAKIESRWPRERRFTLPFDAGLDEDEKLPRLIEMYFDEKTKNPNTNRARTYVYQTCNDLHIGDRLTDNKVEQDDYRFHDVFHLSYAAALGWSPVLRALFRVKRKSDPSIDENQDGARAILIEEGIATWIFNHGISRKDFRNVKKVDYPLLKAIRQFVSGYEVEKCPLWQWELAILEGFKVFRELKKHRRGWVIADLKSHRIRYCRTRPSQPTSRQTEAKFGKRKMLRRLER